MPSGEWTRTSKPDGTQMRSRDGGAFACTWSDHGFFRELLAVVLATGRISDGAIVRS
jgi:hypothetical protein